MVHELFTTHGHELDGFYDVIAELVVKSVLNSTEFLIGLFGKTAFEVIPYHPMAISDKFCDRQIKGIGEKIEHSER
jgi:hypothetical protein